MKAMKISCVFVALMFVSLGFVAAIGANESQISSNDAPVIASSMDMVDQEEYTSDQTVVYVPLYDIETDTYSTTESVEMRIGIDRFLWTSVYGGETKVEDIKYYPSTVAGITEHYDGKLIYISASDLKLISTASSGVAAIIGAILGGGVSGAIISVLASAISSGGMMEEYEHGIAYAIGTNIYLTKTITIPIVPLVVGVYYQWYTGGI